MKPPAWSQFPILDRLCDIARVPNASAERVAIAGGFLAVELFGANLYQEGEESAVRAHLGLAATIYRGP